MFLIIWQVAFILLGGLLAIYLPPFIFYKFSRSSDYKNFIALRIGLACLPSIIFMNSIERRSTSLHVFIMQHWWLWSLVDMLIAFPSIVPINKIGKYVDKRYEKSSRASHL
jgi:hypothetical protein